MLCVVAFAADGKPGKERPHKTVSKTLPVTTGSRAARKLFESGMAKLELWHQNEALADWRAATRKDSKFALAHLFVAYATEDPAEESRELAQAKQFAPRTSQGEQLLIRWLAGVRQGEYVPGIAAMNDLLALYPDDQRVDFLTGRWLLLQERYEQAQMLLERALASDPNDAAAINILGYTYALSNNFEKAFAMMERYVALQPEEPNPHDSYGEILRLAGRYEAAVAQYRMSVKLDPEFGSTIGIADTYALMGREQDARDEYERALLFTTSESQRVGIETQLAITYFRENKNSLGNHALRAVAKHAHQAGLARLEAEAHRIMAMYEPDLGNALQDLETAEKPLNEHHQIAPVDRDEEQALILYTRASRAVSNSRETAEKALQQLQTMAESGRSRVIERVWHAAQGALLVAQGKYAEALPHLEEDKLNPLSMRLLWEAYTKTGKQAQADQIQAALTGYNQVTVEQALVVPRFRETVAEKSQPPQP
jgi:tetratricopeptide (TPR) repeat protein